MEDITMDSMVLLTSTNYAIWKPRMEDILFIKDLYDPLECKGVKPAVMKDEDWKRLNRKTIGLIRQCVGHEVFLHIAQETCAYTLWTKIEVMYMSKNKALLMRRLVNLKLRSWSSVAEHINEFQNLVSQLAITELKFDDETQALLLLSSLPDDWEEVIVSLSNSTPNEKLTMSMVKDALFNEEAKWKMGAVNCNGSHALISEGTRGRSQGRANGSSNKGRSRLSGHRLSAFIVARRDMSSGTAP